MTSLTGSTPATLSGTVKPPSFTEAICGAVVQNSIVFFCWIKYTSFGNCAYGLSQCWADPWARQVLITLGLCLGLWLYSLRTIPTTGTSDPSIVDRLWSLLPWLYCWHWFFSAPSARLFLMCLLSTSWGGRLTLNFYLKGGFSGGEDYRWKEIRSWPGFDRGWEYFNFGFVCLFQQLVILAFSSPAAAALTSRAPLNGVDAAAAILFASLVIGEAVADWQMMAFQTEKYRRIREREPLGPYAKGFIDSGLWAYSRHPNYVRRHPHAAIATAPQNRSYRPSHTTRDRGVAQFCEVSMWWAFYLFSIASGQPLVNWTILGPFFLTCLFVLPRASLDVTETLSSRKYPEYPQYQAAVSRFIPLPPAPQGARPPMSNVDRAFVGWFVIGTAITYLIDIEQVTVTHPMLYGRPGYTPVWPPAPFVSAIHWWCKWDRLVWARPLWYRVAIWLEVLVQAPFYVLAIEAFVRRRNSIRIPAIVYSTVLLTIMPMILFEQYYGPHRTAHPWLVTAVYGAYVVMPMLVLWRVGSPTVFPTSPTGEAGKHVDSPQSQPVPVPKATPQAKGSASTAKSRRRATSPGR